MSITLLEFIGDSISTPECPETQMGLTEERREHPVSFGTVIPMGA